MAFFGSKQPVVDAWQDVATNVARNPLTGLRNAYRRGKNSIATTGFNLQGSGSTNLGRAFLSALTPQTVSAAGRTSSPMVFGDPNDPATITNPLTQVTTDNPPYGPDRSPQDQGSRGTQTQTSQVSGGNRPTPAPVAAQPRSLGWFMGKEYFDPAELYDDQLEYLDSIYGTNLSRLRSGREKTREDFGRQKAGLANQLVELLADYDRQESQGLGSIASYYGGLGDIYQSSQGAREAGFRGDVERARTKTRDQAKEQETALERSLGDYLKTSEDEEQNLARTYATSRSEINNKILNDIVDRLAIKELASSGQATDLTAEDIALNATSLQGLQGLQQSQRYNPFRLESNANLNPILAYLAGVN